MNYVRVVSQKITYAGIIVTAIATVFSCQHVYAEAPDKQPIYAFSSDSKNAVYADGTFKATGQYGSGPSFIPVTITLADGIIKHIAVETPAVNPISLIYQKRFATAVSKLVQGKPIEEVKVDRLAGSSLTPAGFNDAIEKIKQQASRR